MCITLFHYSCIRFTWGNKGSKFEQTVDKIKHCISIMLKGKLLRRPGGRPEGSEQIDSPNPACRNRNH